MNTIHVKKSDGSLQVLNHEKINEMVEKVCEGLSDISPSTIAMNARIQFYDGIPTSTIQQTLIDSAVGLISDLRPEYSYAAARLFLSKIYKEVYNGTSTPPSLFAHVSKMVELKYYDHELTEKFTEEEINELDQYIDYNRDNLLSYAAIQQIHAKYLIQDRTTKHRFETPQQMFMVMAMAFHIDEPKNRIELIKKFYDGVSRLELSMPTPIQAGVRSSMRQYASCALIRSDDSLKSINAAASAATVYGAKRAGLGLDIGGIRAIGTKVGNAGTSHTGVVPFVKKMLAALKSCVTPDTYVEVLVDDTDTREGKIIGNIKRIKIKDLVVGDKIKTMVDGEITFRQVTDKFDTEVVQADQRAITFTNGGKVRCSIRHPIMCLVDGKVVEVLPDDLTPEHDVIGDMGLTHMESISGDDQPTGYIDITVAEAETFFAADDIDSQMVMTHNCNQGGIRSSSVTMFYPFWHYEVEELLVLKNNRGTEETRARHSDYGIKLNALFYKRVQANQDISLFSPHVSKEMYEAFHSSDVEKFEQLYAELEKNPAIRRKTINARDLLSLIATERAGTGRIYIVNIDHVNTHSSFNENVYQSNLCLEITLPTKPFVETVNDGYEQAIIIAKDEKAKEKIAKLNAQYGFVPNKYEGKLYKRMTDIKSLENNYDRAMQLNVQDDTGAEMALCILAALNLGEVKNLHDGHFEQMIATTVRALDNLIDRQEYPVRAAEISAKMSRTLGVGVTNFAYYLAKRGLRYSDGSANKATHELFEAFQFYLIKASVALAKERGPCEWFDRTKYAKGILPIDTYCKGLDSAIGSFELKLDWEALRADVLKYGMRHSTLSAQMPVESSSKTTSSTNGIELPKELFSVKDGVPFVVPEINDLFANYETMWSQPSMTGYMNLVGIMQKFIDQAISGNTFYDPSKFGGKVPIKNIIRDIVYGYKIGWKTMYYHYTNDDDNKEETEQALPSSNDGDEGGECESCKI